MYHIQVPNRDTSCALHDLYASWNLVKKDRFSNELEKHSKRLGLDESQLVIGRSSASSVRFLTRDNFVHVLCASTFDILRRHCNLWSLCGKLVSWCLRNIFSVFSPGLTVHIITFSHELIGELDFNSRYLISSKSS